MPGARIPSRAKALPIAFSIVALAKACRVSRWTMLRWLKDCEVPLRRKGAGLRRQHVFVTMPDLEASPRGHFIKEAIDWNLLLIERMRRPEIPEAEDGED